MMSEKPFYRSVWISDVHLCSRDAQADQLYDFLGSMKCDYLYLVGDIIDIGALRKRWFWPAFYNEVLHKLLKRARKGADVIYIPGNHDDFFRSFVGYHFGDIRVEANAIHETADGRRFLVAHGDEFDTVVKHHRWLAILGGRAYDKLVTINRLVNAVRSWFGMPYWSFAGAVKRRVKQAVKFVNRFEVLLSREAKRLGVDGVVCGHIHNPVIREVDGLLYCNTGDWIENCTALVEHPSGELELLFMHKLVARDTDKISDATADDLAMA